MFLKRSTFEIDTTDLEHPLLHVETVINGQPAYQSACLPNYTSLRMLTCTGNKFQDDWGSGPTSKYDKYWLHGCNQRQGSI